MRVAYKTSDGSHGFIEAPVIQQRLQNDERFLLAASTDKDNIEQGHYTQAVTDVVEFRILKDRDEI